MRCIRIMRFFAVWLLPPFFLIASPSAAQPRWAGWNAVDQALGRTGTTLADGVRRYGFPRSDLHVKLDGVTIKPALALGGWVAFERAGDSSMVMGDLVLIPEEVNPVMSQLLKGGIRVTAVHNHLLRASPQTMYMHIEGRGDPARLAATLHSALALSRTPLHEAPPPPQAAIDLDTASVDRIMRSPGKVNGGVYQFTFPRAEKIVEDGVPAPASMGTGTGINFQPLGAGRAAVTGDFALLAGEVDPVIQTLRSSKIEITALHSHMIGEQPTIYFMHFWGIGKAAELATGLRAALDRTNVQH
jgi:hypothetical protein